jgi:hypothetical protein
MKTVAREEKSEMTATPTMLRLIHIVVGETSKLNITTPPGKCSGEWGSHKLHVGKLSWLFSYFFYTVATYMTRLKSRRVIN